ncbi:chromatin remodeling 1 [Wolffia australiana]
MGNGKEMEMRSENDTKIELPAESPTSVLEDEQDTCSSIDGQRAISEDGDKPRLEAINDPEGKDNLMEHSFLLSDAKNADTSLISKTMAEEEEKLLAERIKHEEGESEDVVKPAVDKNSQFSKLDELLTQTQLYSEFLLEKMDDISFTGSQKETEEMPTGKQKGRGRKRKNAAQYNSGRAKTAVAAMLTRAQESAESEDLQLSEEERIGKEQAELVPLLTGGKLKSYQLKGVKWLISLWQNGLNGILADQMGLGKTIQTIAFLAHLKGKGLHGPYLIIAPLSTLSNWVNEISRFTPGMKAIIYHGSKQERMDIRKKVMPKGIGPKFPIIVTSYEVALNDAVPLSLYKWKYVVVDEGHRLKNTNCLLVKALRRFPIENKLLLTGTPLQNNLAELWSLLNFILPDIFSSHQEFESWFDFSRKHGSDTHPEESEEKRRIEVVSKLHSILRPFLLRRMKQDVEQLLPRKKEIILYADMTDHQKNIQDHLLNKTLENYMENLADNVITRKGLKGKLNNLAIQLRKNCNHPDLLESAYDESTMYPPIDNMIEQCGKLRLLDRLLTLLLERKHKVLIFSQWTKVLDILEYFLEEKGLQVCRIDGNVNLAERRRQIDDFNDVNSDTQVFLLSTRAGGLGINLTAADTCILYDSDWNPQMDLQAMDRCHRIGQTKPVHVYRLATAHSIEGRMLKRAFGKLKLEHVVIGKGRFEQERRKPETLEEAELLALLRDDESPEDKLVQRDISDSDLLRVLDRSDLVVSPGGEQVPSYRLRGPGWEVVLPAKAGGGLLSAVNS